MQLEDYFDFLAPDDIRIKGHWIGIETILYDYIYRSRVPEEIQETYPTLSLEQVYATITYYLHNQEKIDQYIADWIEHGDRMWAEQQRHPSPTTLRLRQLRAEREAAQHKQLEEILDEI
jgi:uncharacterized protein (DUF433 family)